MRELKQNEINTTNGGMSILADVVPAIVIGVACNAFGSLLTGEPTSIYEDTKKNVSGAALVMSCIALNSFQESISASAAAVASNPMVKIGLSVTSFCAPLLKKALGLNSVI